MKKKIWIPIAALAFVLAVLFVPIPTVSYDDGGTREYRSLTYKIVDWKRLDANGLYERTAIYFGEDRNKSIDELWAMECEGRDAVMLATVLEIYEGGVLVEPLEGEAERASSDKITFGTRNLEPLDISVGSVVRVTYGGEIMESYPAQIVAKSWRLS